MEAYWYWMTMMPGAYVQLLLALSAVAVLITVAIKKGFTKRYLCYAYELVLALLFAHFVSTGPRSPSTDILDLLYWASQLGLAPMVLLPYLNEWHDIRSLIVLPQKGVSRFRLTAAMLLGTALGVAILVLSTHFMAKLAESWDVRAQPIVRQAASAPAK